jgi:hypothetical protein
MKVVWCEEYLWIVCVFRDYIFSVLLNYCVTMGLTVGLNVSTVTMLHDITTEINVCSLLQSNNATDIVLLNNVMKVGNLVLSRTFFSFC